KELAKCLPEDEESSVSMELRLELSEERECPRATLRLKGEAFDVVVSCECEGIELDELIDQVVAMAADLIEEHDEFEEEDDDDEMEDEDEDEDEDEFIDDDEDEE